MHSKFTVFSVSSIDFDRIRKTRDRILLAGKALNTRASYSTGWSIFVRWCRAAGRTHLPASPETLEEFAVWMIAEEYRLATVVSRVCAVGAYHIAAGLSSPFDAQVRELLSCARRDLQEQPRGKRALSYELLCRVLRRLPDTAGGTRNRAMILLTFATGWRRSEIVAIGFSDLQFSGHGLTVWQGTFED